MDGSVPVTTVLGWLMVPLGGLVLTGFSVWLNSTSKRIADVADTQHRQGERIASLEATTSGTVERLDRIEQLLHQLLERTKP